MHRWRIFAALLLLFIAFAEIALLITIDRYGRLDGAQESDVIIVLGAGWQAKDQPSVSMIARARHGAILYQLGLAESVLCSGGYTMEGSQSEARACASILLETGLPAEAIVLEEISESTEENAIQAAKIMAEHSWEQALLVSSRYHLWRSRWLFERMGISVNTSPAPPGYLSATDYLRALFRELLAVNWQLAIDALGLPWTDFPP